MTNPQQQAESQSPIEFATSSAQPESGSAKPRRTRASRSREERPWGSYEVLARGPGFQVKRLTVKPDSRLSYQWHRHRTETWTVARGIATVTLDGETQNLGPSQTLHVPRTAKHRIANPSSVEPLEVIEVQTGDYLGEDDIVRESDDYGRG